MIKTIIFDFGNVFINLKIDEAYKHALKQLNIDTLSNEMIQYNRLYEQGLISTEEFLNFYTKNTSKLSEKDFIDIWNFMLQDFPKYRLDFLKVLKSSKKYKLILLSNTNALHINYIKEHISFYNEFKNCFDKFYLSHNINLIKPNHDIFEFVLNENKLNPEECLFIDDNKDNINTANTLNIKTWHINPEHEDVISLFKTKSPLFDAS